VSVKDDLKPKEGGHAHGMGSTPKPKAPVAQPSAWQAMVDAFNTLLAVKPVGWIEFNPASYRQILHSKGYDTLTNDAMHLESASVIILMSWSFEEEHV
jgi:hypothetical protein